MKTYSKKKIFIGLLIVILIALVTYNAVSSISVVHADSTSSSATSSPVDQNILTLLSSFQNVTIDSSLFSSNLFQSLKDFSTTLPTEPEGRANPFAPIGNETGTVAPASSNTFPLGIKKK
jgi:hypothetical protein